MSLTERRAMIRVFEDKAQACKAINDLRSIGITDDQIGIAEREGGWMAQCALENLVNLGIPEEEVTLYKREFEAGHVVVAVKFRCTKEEMLNFLISNSGPEQLTIYINDVSISHRDVRKGHNDGSQDHSSNALSDNSCSPEASSAASGEMSSLWNLLKVAGLEHLL